MGEASDWVASREIGWSDTMACATAAGWLGIAGLSVAALSMSAAIVSPNGNLRLVFLWVEYGGILFQQPTLCALSCASMSDARMPAPFLDL